MTDVDDLFDCFESEANVEAVPVVEPNEETPR